MQVVMGKHRLPDFAFKNKQAVPDLLASAKTRRNMKQMERHLQKEPEHKFRIQDGSTPSYRAFHEVLITKDLESERNNELKEFIVKHIAEYKGISEEKHGIPQMLFERKQDAQMFANELAARLNIHKEHISVKARKFTR
jgi:hypothetical protein